MLIFIDIRNESQHFFTCELYFIRLNIKRSMRINIIVLSVIEDND